MKRPAAAKAARTRKVLKPPARGASDAGLLVLHDSASPGEKIPSLADLQSRTKKLIGELHPAQPVKLKVWNIKRSDRKVKHGDKYFRMKCDSCASCKWFGYVRYFAAQRRFVVKAVPWDRRGGSVFDDQTGVFK